MEYENLTFVGREIPPTSFEGKTKDNRPWKRFVGKFRNSDGAEIKSSMFTEPKKGLCVTKLVEGTLYKVGYIIEDYTPPDGELIKMKQVKFVDVIHKEEEKDTTQGTDLLSTQQPKEIMTTANVDNMVLRPDETEILNQLKDLAQCDVTEQAFKETCAGRISACGENRQAELWAYYKAKVIGQ